jgi:hypothetical protein
MVYHYRKAHCGFLLYELKGTVFRVRALQFRTEPDVPEQNIVSIFRAEQCHSNQQKLTHQLALLLTVALSVIVRLF